MIYSWKIHHQSTTFSYEVSDFFYKFQEFVKHLGRGKTKEKEERERQRERRKGEDARLEENLQALKIKREC
jgi:hypothetical protein